ncbi:hypothetical protein [Streptomyces spectabilis]
MADDKLYPYENKNWAMLIKADPDHPLKPGTKTGGMVILIQNISKAARKLNSYIGLTYRTSSTPGQVVFTSPWEKSDELNGDTPVGGTFAPDGLPGDRVFLTIEPQVNEGRQVRAIITSIEQGRRVWSFVPRDGWKEGTTYTVTAWSEMDGHTSAPVARKFKATAPMPSVTLLTPGRDDAEISPMARLTGSYGGTVRAVGGITVQHNGTPLTVRQDDPVKGTWTADPPRDGWVLGAEHRLVVQAKNETRTSQEIRRTFKVSKIKPGDPKITVPPEPVAAYYSKYKPPKLAGIIVPFMQLGSQVSLGPCDKVTVFDPQQPERTMTANLDYDSEHDTYQWSLDTDWTASDTGVAHDVVVTAWLGNEPSRPARIGFLMKTPEENDNPIQFTSPRREEPEANSRVEITGTALLDTPNITISEQGEPTTNELPAVVATTTDAHLTHWSWKPKGEWKTGRHTIVVTASRPSQKNDISFTVAGPPQITISRPVEGANIFDHNSIDGSLPSDAREEEVSIVDTVDGQDKVFKATNNGDRTFHYAPQGEQGAWRPGYHSVVAKAGGYTSDPRGFTVIGKNLVSIRST